MFLILSFVYLDLQAQLNSTNNSEDLYIILATKNKL